MLGHKTRHATFFKSKIIHSLAQMELNYIKLVIPVAPGASVPECPPTAWFVSVEVSMNIRNPFMKTGILLFPEI